MRAWLNLRYTDDARAALFRAGLARLGYEPVHGITQEPQHGDIFVTWNRIGVGDTVAKVFEARELPVLVVENASWGNDFAGDRWYHIARNRHNTAGLFPVGGLERWNTLNVDLCAWRTSGETVILPQRGIGSEPTRMPAWFTRKAIKRHGGRVRVHPGKHAQRNPLEQDLARCGKVVTWGSGAAIKALMWGIPVMSYMPDWIGEQDNTDAGRVAMFQRLAWGQWTHNEIAQGIPFEHLIYG